MELLTRIARHARINGENLSIPDVPGPPFVILFINSICNMKCEHCFYWQSLNSPDDLTYEEIVNLSNQLGHVENLTFRAVSRSCAKSSERSAASSGRITASRRSTYRPTATSRKNHHAASRAAPGEESPSFWK